MFKRTSRCSILMLLVVGVITLGFSSIATAQLHGAAILKGCTSPVRNCDDDADCDDGNACTDDVCDLTYTDTINCTIQITNQDGYYDTLSINFVEDVLAGGLATTPSSAMTITVSGGATCAAGNTALPCILPRTPVLDGRIELNFDAYNPAVGDVGTLSDQATGKYFDLCDNPGTSGCDPITNQTLQAGASVTVVEACGSTPTVCPAGDACNIPFCDPATGCGLTPVECPPGDACNIPFCDPVTGCGTDPVECPPGDACNIPFCDPVTGCGTDPVECPPGDACNIPFCDPVTGCGTDPVECPPPADPVCFVSICDPVDGCGEVEITPTPPECLDLARCRTPGFWGTHGGDEKAPRSQNITQAVIDQALAENGLGLPVCGTYISNTDLLSDQSAIEAMCVSVRGEIQRQLVRQLTATQLNCQLGECPPEIEAMVATCNTVCDTGIGDANYCIEQLDCFNNGGDWDGGMCVYGAGFCEIGGEYCDDDTPCVGLGDYCQPDETCHDRDLCPDFEDDGEINGSDFCFEPPGPASSPRKCSAANKNDTYVP